MIPKIIHYCWFGEGKKSKLAKKCIESWKKYCPDYEIREWNESNFDVYMNDYTKYCYENKKWAFLSDYARLYVVEKYGGVYFDTDVEVIRNIDELLNYNAFYGFENDNYIASGLGFGSVANHSIIKKMSMVYLDMKTKNSGEISLIGCPILNTEVISEFGFTINGEMQNIEGVILLPVDYLNPYDDSTGALSLTKNTYSIHWYSKSALSFKKKLRSKFTRPFHRVFGKNCFQILKRNKRIKNE